MDQYVSKRFFDAVFGASDDCVKILDLEGRLKYMSEGGRRVMEVDDFASVSGCVWTSFWDGEARSAAEAALESARRGEASVFEGPCATAKGSPRHWRVKLAPLRGEDGRIEAILSISTDISGEAAAREAAARSERSFRTLIDSVPQIVWSTDADGAVDFFNARWTERTGMSVEDSLGAGWLAALHPDDAPKVAAIWSDCVRERKSYQVEYRLRDRAGGYRAFLAQGVPILDASGRIERWLGALTDIDDLRAAQAALAAARTRLELALSASQIVGTFVWDNGVERLYPDRRFCEIFGMSPPEGEEGMPGDVFAARVHPDDRERRIAGLREAMARDGDFSIEFRISTPQGWRWIHKRGRVEKDERGRMRAMLGIIVDITDRKRDEETIALISRELVHRIKNVFAVVSGILSLTAREFPDAKPAFATVRGRLNALAQANDLIAVGRAAGSAGQSAQALIRRLAEPYQLVGRERILVSGDDAPIDEQMATGLALVLHELATNAVKYGALSAEDGSVVVALSATPERLAVAWREQGGPAVTGEPERQGFGSLLVQRTLEGLEGAMQRRWAPGGLEVDIEMRSAG